MANEPNLTRLLTAEMTTRQAVERALAEAAADAERTIRGLDRRRNVGSRVELAQVRLVLREIRIQQRKLWDTVSDEVEEGVKRAETGARQSVNVLHRVAVAAGVDVPRSSYEARARAVVRASIARETLSKRELSATVYKHQALTNGWVESTLRAGIGSGKTAREIALQVQKFISPSTPGGAAYAAKRLARTELANAYHAGTRAGYADNPFVERVAWRLSGSHPKPDICDELADAGPYDSGEVPDKPHPHCLCTLIPEEVEEEEFIRRFNRGDYNAWLRQSDVA